MPSVSGLSYEERIQCRLRVVQAARLAYANRDDVHYTQDLDQRWEGIADKLSSAVGHFPTHADCSSFATWVLWNGLYLMFGRGDRVNGTGPDWTGGNTGTMLQHGVRVMHASNALRGDCVFYEVPPNDTRHVAVVATRVGGLKVISHGSEDAPHLVAWDHWPVTQIRRYI